MNQFEKNMLRLADIQRQYFAIPSWAKAEQLERSVSQRQIWKMAKMPRCVRGRKLKK